MSEEFKLEIITPERVVFSDNVSSISVYTLEGRIEVLHDHRPLVTKTVMALMNFKQDSKSNSASLSRPGFLEVAPGKATVLCDAAELGEEIDKERAEKAKERAEERLQTQDEKTDYARARAALNRAITRINAVERG